MSDAIKEFVLQVERSLASRRLYPLGSEPYRETCQKLFETCRTAVGGEGFTLRVGPADLYLKKTSLIHRPKREDCYFFPLYRDGLRELCFTPEVTAEDLEALVKTFEAEEKLRLSTTEDTVGFLWRCDLTTITYNAIDGIGSEEGDDDPEQRTEDFGAVVTDLVEKIKNPASASSGQSYSFMVDADVQIADSDFHYEATTAHRSFEENPAVLRLTGTEARAIRDEVGEEREAALLERFAEILRALLADASRAVPVSEIAPVLRHLLEAYWNARDVQGLGSVLRSLKEVAGTAPLPESRTAATEILVGFFADERVQDLCGMVQEGSLPLAEATRLWDCSDDKTWGLVVEFFATLPEGELRMGLTAVLKGRLSSNPELLRSSLGSDNPVVVRAAASLMDRRLEALYAEELLALASHADEGVRQRGVAAAGRIGGPKALEVLWKAMQGDRSRAVRLLAFRQVATSNLPGLSERLRALVMSPEFGSRPLWERVKYVRLLGATAGESARALFEDWIPQKRWFWQPRDLEQAELALRGLSACGGAGLERVRELAGRGGKLGDLAKEALESRKRGLGETVILKPGEIKRSGPPPESVRRKK